LAHRDWFRAEVLLRPFTDVQRKQEGEEEKLQDLYLFDFPQRTALSSRTGVLDVLVAHLSDSKHQVYIILDDIDPGMPVVAIVVAVTADR